MMACSWGSLARERPMTVEKTGGYKWSAICTGFMPSGEKLPCGLIEAVGQGLDDDLEKEQGDRLAPDDSAGMKPSERHPA